MAIANMYERSIVERAINNIATERHADEFVSSITAVLSDQRILDEVQNRFFRGCAAKVGAAAEPYDKRPLYIVVCETRQECELAWAAKPPFVRAKIIPTYEFAPRWEGVPQLGSAVLEHGLGEASQRLALAAALMDDDWAGARLLGSVRSAPGMTAEASHTILGADEETTTAVVSRLVAAGLAAISDELISCTPTGKRILQRLERAAGVDLTPRDPQGEAWRSMSK